MSAQLKWIYSEDDGCWITNVLDLYYGIAHEGKDYAAYVNSDAFIGGYLDNDLKVAAGFGIVCARGFHPDTICASEQDAKDRCQKHYEMTIANISKLA